MVKRNDPGMAVGHQFDSSGWIWKAYQQECISSIHLMASEHNFPPNETADLL